MDDWCVVQEFPQYEVNRNGQIRETNGHTLVLPYKGSEGYLRLNCVRNGVRCVRKVHRWFAQAFLPPREEHQSDVDHINRDRTNNCIVNLRWSTRSDNIKNCKRWKNRFSQYRGVTYSIERRRWVAQLREGGRSHVRRFCTEAEAARQYNAWAKEHRPGVALSMLNAID